MAIKKQLRLALVSAGLLIVPIVPGNGHAKYKADPVAIAQLPHFCWAQYMDNVSGPEYQIDPRDCGWGMNHYCPGLIKLIEAKRSFGDRRKRLGYLQVAKEDTLYTLRAMKDYPACSLRGHVEKTLNEINGYLRAMGQK